ncbi:MAG: response regulator [Polyangiales bacterium]
MTRACVLIVDDDSIVRRAILRALAPLDVELVAAGSCAEARAHAGTIDLAIVDYDLGDGYGDDLAHDLLVSPRLRAVVFFTASSEQRVTDRLATLGRVVSKIDDGVEMLRSFVAEHAR